MFSFVETEIFFPSNDKFCSPKPKLSVPSPAITNRHVFQVPAALNSPESKNCDRKDLASSEKLIPWKRKESGGSALIKVECSFSTSTVGLSNTITERAASFSFSRSDRMHSLTHTLFTYRSQSRFVLALTNWIQPGGGEAVSGGKMKEREEVALATTEGFSTLVAWATSNRRSLNMRQQARSGVKEGGKRGWEEEVEPVRRGKGESGWERKDPRHWLAEGAYRWVGNCYRGRWGDPVNY